MTGSQDKWYKTKFKQQETPYPQRWKNKNEMKKLITTLITATTLVGLAQQDPQFSQYQFNQMVINH